MEFCKTKKGKVLLSLFMVTVMLITGIFAALTDRDEKVNAYTSGSIKIQLWETCDQNLDGSILGMDDDGCFDANNFSDEVYGPKDGVKDVFASELLATNVDIIKAPWIYNSGRSTAKVCISVGMTAINLKKFKDLDFPDGTSVSQYMEDHGITEMYELFTPYYINEDGVKTPGFNPDWTKISQTNGTSKVFYLYAYNYDLEPGERTSNLFDGVVFAPDYDPIINFKVDKNELDEDILVESEDLLQVNIPIKAYGVQRRIDGTEEENLWELFTNYPWNVEDLSSLYLYDVPEETQIYAIMEELPLLTRPDMSSIERHTRVTTTHEHTTHVHTTRAETTTQEHTTAAETTTEWTITCTLCDKNCTSAE